MDNIVIKNTEARQELLEFLHEYQKWVENGALDSPIFDRRLGLCTNLISWLDMAKMRLGATSSLLSNLLPKQKSGHKLATPFNTSFSAYMQESFDEVSHLNNNRNKWVNDTIVMLEKENV